jgi:cysteinyl-tRNA synthetase
MSTKYLGETFDIHGGGMDLKFPHHECEIAQATGANGKSPVNYWLHSNMLTVNGQKMSKSLGNSFLPRELFAGDHPLLERGYGAMTVRFFMLQSHYSSTLDFSNEALSAAEKGFKKLIASLSTVKKFVHEGKAGSEQNISEELQTLAEECHLTMSDDFNTAKTLAVLFEMSSRINDIKSGNISLQILDKEKFEFFQSTYINIMEHVLGLREEEEHNHELLNGVIQVLIDLRKKARTDRNYALSDKIRDELKQKGVQVMDGKDGEMTWVIE